MPDQDPTALDTCPRIPCRGSLSLASEEQIVAGVWIWSCSAGHHGPRVLFGSPAA